MPVTVNSRTSQPLLTSSAANPVACSEVDCTPAKLVARGDKQDTQLIRDLNCCLDLNKIGGYFGSIGPMGVRGLVIADPDFTKTKHASTLVSSPTPPVSADIPAFTPALALTPVPAITPATPTTPTVDEPGAIAPTSPAGFLTPSPQPLPIPTETFPVPTLSEARECTKMLGGENFYLARRMFPDLAEPANAGKVDQCGEFERGANRYLERELIDFMRKGYLYPDDNRFELSMGDNYSPRQAAMLLMYFQAIEERRFDPTRFSGQNFTPTDLMSLYDRAVKSALYKIDYWNSQHRGDPTNQIVIKDRNDVAETMRAIDKLKLMQDD